MHIPWAYYSLRYSIAFGIVSDSECPHIIMFTLGTIFQSCQNSRKIKKFPKTMTIFFYFAWLFTALLLSKRMKDLYKMNNDSI